MFRLDVLYFGESKELDYWSAKLTLSLNIMQGNTDQLDYGTCFNAKRRTSLFRVYTEDRGNIGYLEGTETSNNQRIDGDGVLQPIAA